VQARQNKELTHHFLSAGRCLSISRKTGLHHAYQLLGKTRAVTVNVTPFLLLPPAFIVEYDVVWCAISLWSISVSCPSCDPS